MSKYPPSFVADFDLLIQQCEVQQSIARDSKLQQDACALLEQAIEDVRSEKQRAIADKEEEYANLLLGCQCVATALLAELRMWILLKMGKPDDAWNQLVEAQMSSTDAVRAHNNFQHLEYNHQRLVAIEHLVFPPQVFLSSGVLVGFQECSVCGVDYDNCDHLIGKPYMGELCYIIARDFVFDHVSVVKDPADKRCRVTQFSVEGGVRNKMTWLVEPNTTNAAVALCNEVLQDDEPPST